MGQNEYLEQDEPQIEELRVGADSERLGVGADGVEFAVRVELGASDGLRVLERRDCDEVRLPGPILRRRRRRAQSGDARNRHLNRKQIKITDHQLKTRILSHTKLSSNIKEICQVIRPTMIRKCP